MKTENTLENKAKFLLHCYAEDRSSIKSNQGSGVVFGILDIIHNPEHYYSELTPLSQITDEDAVEVAQILTRFKWDLDLGTKVIKEGNQITVYYEELKGGFGHKTIIYDDFFSRNYTGEPAKPLCGDSFDYLRSKGYALPWMGLSVEELISYGWVKLKQNEND